MASAPKLLEPIETADLDVEPVQPSESSRPGCPSSASQAARPPSQLGWTSCTGCAGPPLALDVQSCSQINGVDLSTQGGTQKDQPKRSTPRGSNSKDQLKKISNFKAQEKIKLDMHKKRSKDQKKDQSAKKKIKRSKKRSGKRPIR